MPKKKKSTKKDVKDVTETKVPASVQAAAEKADEMQQDIIEQTDDGKSSKDDSTDATPDPNDQPAVEPNPDPDPKPVNQEPTPAEPAAEPNKDSWEHKYLVLQGKYNSDIGRLNEQVETLTGTITGLTKALETQPAAAASSQDGSISEPAPAGNPIIDLMDVAEFERYGDEFGKMATALNAVIDHISKTPAASSSAAAPELEQRLQRVEHTTFKSAEETFFEKLKDAIPNYDTLNKNPALPGWLAEQDPVSMYVRKDMIDFAFKSLNAPQAIAILTQFARENNIEIPSAAPSSGGQTDTTDADSQTTGNLTDKTVDDPLASQAMPGQTVGSGGENVNQPAPVNAATYGKAVQDFTRGSITKEAFQKIESAFHGSLKKK
jgi:hypothetical protein